MVLEALRARFARTGGTSASPSHWAVIDIGSNSIRLVIWTGPRRLPTVVLNEKVTANLGRTLAETGRLSPKGVKVGLEGLARFALLVRQLEVEEVRTVATAAVREAADGADFLDKVRALGLEPELLSGEQEAAAAAHGVLSAFPDGDGVVGDLGGGSLELTELTGGALGRADSFPWGSLRLPALMRPRGNFDRQLRDALEAKGWRGAAAGRTFYMVGGSWRSLAKVAMHRTGWPLFDPHGFTLAPADIAPLAAAVATPKALTDIPGIASGRLAALPHTTALLDCIVRHLKPARIVTSSFGLREGLLFGELDAETRALDPLLVAVRDFCAHERALAIDGDLLARWIAPLFADEGPAEARLRIAACLLSGVVQAAPRELRGQRAMDLALHERWIGLGGGGRAMIAAALLVDAGEKSMPTELSVLCEPARLKRATMWGQAMRFGVKLAGGASSALTDSRLELGAKALTLAIDPALGALYGDAVRNQHRALADLLEREPAIVERA